MPGSARSDEIAHQDAKIAAGDLNQQPFKDVGMTSQMGSSHAARLKVMLERSLQEFTALSESSFPAFTAYAPPVRIGHSLRGLVVFPLPRSGSDMYVRYPSSASVTSISLP